MRKTTLALTLSFPMFLGCGLLDDRSDSPLSPENGSAEKRSDSQPNYQGTKPLFPESLTKLLLEVAESRVVSANHGVPVVVCANELKDEISSIELFDFYESYETKRTQFNIGAAALNEWDKVALLIERVAKVDSVRAKSLSNSVQMFKVNFKLTDSKDMPLASMPVKPETMLQKGCAIINAATHQTDSPTRSFFVSRSVWSLLNTDQKAGIIFHHAAQNDQSIGSVRRYTSLVASTTMGSLNLDGYISEIEKTYTYNLMVDGHDLDLRSLEKISFYPDGKLKSGRFWSVNLPAKNGEGITYGWNRSVPSRDEFDPTAKRVDPLHHCTSLNYLEFEPNGEPIPLTIAAKSLDSGCIEIKSKGETITDRWFQMNGFDVGTSVSSGTITSAYIKPVSTDLTEFFRVPLDFKSSDVEIRSVFLDNPPRIGSMKFTSSFCSPCEFEVVVDGVVKKFTQTRLDLNLEENSQLQSFEVYPSSLDTHVILPIKFGAGQFHLLKSSSILLDKFGRFYGDRQLFETETPIQVLLNSLQFFGSTVDGQRCGLNDDRYPSELALSLKKSFSLEAVFETSRFVGYKIEILLDEDLQWELDGQAQTLKKGCTLHGVLKDSGV